MWKGEVVSIHTAPEAGAPMRTLEEARAVAGKGIEGDRYFEGAGFYSNKSKMNFVDRQVTLIESEVLDMLRRDYGVELAPEECRRNVVTRGVPLPHLVGKTFRVGGALLRGARLNEPCVRLEELTGKEIRENLIHRSGLNAEILESGTIRPGDAVEEV